MLSHCRPWPCVHSLPTSSDPSSLASGLVRVLLCHDHLVGNRWSGQLQSSLFFPPNYLRCFLICCSHNNLSSIILQFVGLESVITSLSDTYPSHIRKGYRRELLLLLICVFCYVLGLFLVSEVSSKKYVQRLPHTLCHSLCEASINSLKYHFFPISSCYDPQCNKTN